MIVKLIVLDFVVELIPTTSINQAEYRLSCIDQ